MQPNELYALTNTFLVTTGIFAAALGAAPTDGLKAGLSLSAFFLAILWAICTINKRCELTTPPLREEILVYMPFLFVVGWFFSFKIHIQIWLNSQ